jgi:hypothetical protein
MKRFISISRIVVAASSQKLGVQGLLAGDIAARHQNGPRIVEKIVVAAVKEG